MSWTEERVAEAKRLFLKEGRSAGEIARSLNCGLSRNAVIGKLSREGVTRGRGAPTITLKRRSPPPVTASPGHASMPEAAKRPHSIAYHGKATDSPTTKRLAGIVLANSAPAAADETSSAANPTLLTLKSRCCRWPVGLASGAEQRFCGQAKESDDGPYCARHQAKARGASARTTPDELVRSVRRLA